MCSISVASNFNGNAICDKSPDKRIRWKDEIGDELTTIILIAQTDEERIMERKNKDWRITYRYASKFASHDEDGLGCNWSRFQANIDRLEEPDWCCIGQLWARHYGKSPRFEEASFEDTGDKVTYRKVPQIFVTEEDDLMSSVIKTDHDSEYSVQKVSFEDLDSLSSLEDLLDSQAAKGGFSCDQNERDYDSDDDCFEDLDSMSDLEAFLDNMHAKKDSLGDQFTDDMKEISNCFSVMRLCDHY